MRDLEAGEGDLDLGQGPRLRMHAFSGHAKGRDMDTVADLEL